MYPRYASHIHDFRSESIIHSCITRSSRPDEKRSESLSASYESENVGFV